VALLSRLTLLTRVDEVKRDRVRPVRMGSCLDNVLLYDTRMVIAASGARIEGEQSEGPQTGQCWVCRNLVRSARRLGSVSGVTPIELRSRTRCGVIAPRFIEAVAERSCLVRLEEATPTAVMFSFVLKPHLGLHRLLHVVCRFCIVATRAGV
jgi:hypothetical protein